ncbi:MAG: EF-hand domain-containing protein [Pseudomonadales bacterium]|nr:EF-hand domain-containing protein [Pseudomonadales bacterium]
MNVKRTHPVPADLLPDDDLVDEFRELFEQTDTDGDGSISFPEFKTMMADLDADMSDSALRIGFHEVDLDRDGAINLDELRTWWNSN